MAEAWPVPEKGQEGGRVIVWHSLANQLEHGLDPDSSLPREPRCTRNSPNGDTRVAIQALLSAARRAHVFVTCVSSF